MSSAIALNAAIAPNAAIAAIAAIAGMLCLAAAACSPRVLIAVDPAPPNPCTGDSTDAAGCVPTGLLDGLVGYWKLDDGTGSATARDSSGQGNNGSLISVNADMGWVPGKSGTALELDGLGWVNVAPSTSIDGIVDQVTVASWIYLEGTVIRYGTAASRQIGSGIQQHYHVSLNGDVKPTLFITTGLDDVALLTAKDAVVPRTWVHLAGTYDGMNARLYVNGVEAASQPLTGTFAPDTTALIIGGNGNDASGVPTELFPGRLDEVMLYHRALSAAEIGRLYTGTLFMPPPPGVDAGVD
jgi:hypothetical protein